MPSNVYFEIATGIFDTEFAGDTGIATVSQISGWLSYNVGQLNVLLHENFTGENPDGFSDAAGSIFSDLYMISYYDRTARNALRGVISTASDNVLSIADGDNRISFVNKNEVAKVYKGFSSDLRLGLTEKTNKYCMYKSAPLQVGGIECSISGYYSPCS